jgi:hypothetical protein
MNADVITYNATISTCEKGQQWITVMSSLREMRQLNMNANVITYNATISTCGKGQQCHHQRVREVPAVHHCDKLATGDAAVEHGGQYCDIQRRYELVRKVQQCITAISLLREMQQCNMINTIIYNATISTCEKG